MALTDQQRIDKLRAAALLILDQVDYTADPPACGVTEMVGGVLSQSTIETARTWIKEATS